MFSSLYVVSLLLNLVLFFREAELQPKFTAVPPNPFTVLEGHNISLEWSYDLAGESFARVEFVDVTSSPSARILEVNTVGQTPDRLNDNYIGRVQVDVTATHTSITIFGANRTVDSKDYEFEIVPGSSDVVPSLVTILVQYPPEFTNVSANQTVIEGGPSITLECIAIGEPPPSITWTRVFDNGSDSDVLFTGEQFVLDNNRSSTGTYRCTAYNGIGIAPNRTIAVDVTYKPEIVKLMVNDSNICKGDIISITCSADGKPAVHTQLFENDIPVAKSDTTVIWKRTMSAQGSFTYRCVANNTVGTTDKNVTVIVNVPTVVYPLENITVTEGENSTLTCNVSGSPTPSVTWTEEKTGFLSMGITRELTHINRNQSGEYKCEASNLCGNDTAKTFVIVQYQPGNFQFAASEREVCQDEVINFTCSADGNPAVDTYQLLENNTMVTDGANSHGMWSRTMSDGGVFIYKCEANNTVGTGQSEAVTVTINVPLAIQPIQNVNITEGENLTLLCNVSGFPLPMVSWIKVGVGVITDKNELMFTNINRTQSGEYRCESSNQCGNASETATIEVQYLPENVKLETSAADNKACRDDVISINCSADAVPSVTSYQLFENDVAILGTSGMWTRNLTTEGMFIYKCVANNSLGTGESASVTVTVNVASSIQPIEKQTIMEGYNLTVVCNASGIPPPMVTWIKVDGGDISPSGSELVFTNINRSEAGEYRCDASNECRNASVTATIEVHFKPDNVQLETSAAGNKACRGDVLSINCSAEAGPSEISYQLLENNKAILDASGRWNRPLTTAGMFTYKCVPNNTLGTGENATVTVTVNVPSSIQLIPNKTMAKEFENVTVSCDASGTFPVMVSWIKVDDGERFEGSELVFTHINRTQAGEYRCDASNECGNASETATIEVQYKPENVLLKTSAVDNKACKGENITFNCSADAVPFVTSYELFENDSVIMNTSGMWSRTLSSGGVFVYKCVANNSLGSMESESITVTVNVPSAIEPIHNKNTTEGGSVTLSCSASGTPHPMVSWIKVDSQEQFNSRDLVFTNITRSQAGEYKCEASNECGNASETATIEVQYPPENVLLKTSAVDSKTCKEKTISINCSANAAPSVTSYELFENDSLIMDTSGMWSRTFSSGGVFIYKCVANNSLGSTESESVTVTVNVRSSIYPIQNETVTEEDSVTLSCSASGMPSPMVSWIKVDGHTRSDSSELMFTNINRGEAGEYRCEASNECGNASETAWIFVQYMPEITSIMVNQTVNKGDIVSLNCTADGYPTPTTTWTKVSDNSSVSFPLTISGKQNEGLYRCTADNGIGSPATEEVFITVHLPSSIEPLKNKTDVKKGGSVTLYCNVSGTPTPHVSWTQVSTGEKWVSKTKVIVDVKVDDLGEYKCEASNPYGNATDSIFIFFPGGLCEKKCTNGKSCRKFGQFVCLCEKGKKGADCKEKDDLKTNFEVGIVFNEDFEPDYEDLENQKTVSFVNKITDAVKKEFSGSGLKDVKVTKLRKGSVIADIKLTFNQTVGASEVGALLTEAAKDGIMGDLKVGGTNPDGFIKEPEKPDECGTFFEGEDCKKAKPGLIALCVVGGVIVLGILVAIIACFVKKNKSSAASFSNGNYAQRVEPEGNIANGGRETGRGNYGYENDRANGHSFPSETQMVTFKNMNPAETPGIAINDSSVTQKAQPGEGTYADLGDFHQKAPAPATQEPLKMPPTYEKTEYAEISQFLRAPITTDEEAKDESSQDDQSSLNQEESLLQEHNTDNSDVRSQEILLEI